MGFSKFMTGCFSNPDENPVTSIRGQKGKKSTSYQWEKSLATHLYGKYSMALVQSNEPIEDHCQLVSGALSERANGPNGVFVGIYDGHGGAACSKYVCETLFRCLRSE